MLDFILIKYWKQHPTKLQLNVHFSPIELNAIDTIDFAGEAEPNSLLTFSSGLINMATPILNDQ